MEPTVVFDFGKGKANSEYVLQDSFNDFML